jgi:signal transduction histidine kinase
MTDLIDEIHDLACLDLGQRMELNLRPTDLAQLVGQLVEEHASATTSHHFVFEATDTPLIGRWDSVRLARVVENLLTNAIKYSESGTDIRVTVSRGTEENGAAVNELRGGSAEEVIRPRKPWELPLRHRSIR